MCSLCSHEWMNVNCLHVYSSRLYCCMRVQLETCNYWWDNVSIRHGIPSLSVVHVVWRQLRNANSLLDECQQPYQYLIESIRKRDEEISRLRQTLQTLDTDLRFAEADLGLERSPFLSSPLPPFLSPPSLSGGPYPVIRLGGLGECWSSPRGSGWSPAAKHFLVHCRLKRTLLVITIMEEVSHQSTVELSRQRLLDYWKVAGGSIPQLIDWQC